MVAGRVVFDLLECCAFLGTFVKQLAQDVGGFLECFPLFEFAFGLHGAACAHKAQRTREQVEFGGNVVFPQRFGLLHLFGRGVSHGV